MKTTILILLTLPLIAAAQSPDRIIIPHDVHFENDVDCATCHDGVESSTSALEVFRPDMDTCADCHDVDDDDTCAMCHTDVDTAGEWTPGVFGASLFNHAAHVGDGMDCTACHGDPGAPTMPVKADCRACHDTADAYTDCRLCHDGGFELTPADHGGDWEHLHGLEARLDGDRCEECHGPSACLECHAGDNVAPRVHELGFAWNHGMVARSGELECTTCHQEPADCVSCHRAERVLPLNHSRADWLSPMDGGAHAVEGLFDLESCVACHDAGASEPTCARCHEGGAR